MKKQLALALAGLVIVISAGLVHGKLTSRWRLSSALADVTTRLPQVPMQIGNWTSVEVPIGARELKGAGAFGWLSRRYAESGTGVAASVMLLVGLPGDIATHTPDVCYPGAGYTLGGSEEMVLRYGTPERTVKLRTAIARKEGPSPSVLRIYWAWNDRTGWSAPDDARWTYATAPALCKLYVVRETSGGVVPPTEDPCIELIAQLLPAIDRVVFSDTPTSVDQERITPGRSQ
jgi:hypothetical protein